jgi:XTP/dITP diphosphohydrolase
VNRSARPTFVLASGNAGKLAELRSLLGDLVDVRSASELGATLPEETGSTFEENAILKARAVAEQTGFMAIADDSGLEVDALGGAPGVYSARYAGDDADDRRNNEKLLRELASVGDRDRSARFRCAIAIAYSPDDVETAFGSCEGRVLHAPRGTGGFGYDPLFELPGGPTMAELNPDEKNAVSHRGRAMREAISLIRNRLESSVLVEEAG